MAVSALMYGNFLKCALNKEVTLGTGTTGIKCMLCTSSYIPNQDTHIYKDVSVTNEVVGTNYVAGGNTLTNVAVTYNASDNTIKIDADDTIWANSSIALARYAVIYDNTPISNKPLIAYVDFGNDVSSTSGDFSIIWDANGIFTITTT